MQYLSMMLSSNNFKYSHIIDFDQHGLPRSLLARDAPVWCALSAVNDPVWGARDSARSGRRPGTRATEPTAARFGGHFHLSSPDLIRHHLPAEKRPAATVGPGGQISARRS
jgi:hypothetical protein